jgi:hypothetical protein
MLDIDFRRWVCSVALGIAISGCGSTPPKDANGAGATGGADTWINRTAGTPAAGLPWTDVASDSTGTRLVAVTRNNSLNPEGDIWTSSDAGATWTNRTKGTPASGQLWQSVASDATGSTLVAVTAFTGISGGREDVWASADAGATWNKRITVSSTARGVVGPTVASDSTGTHLTLADGDIWTSSDSGATWNDQTVGTVAAALSWVDLASDATGAHLVAITADGDIWTSSDSGATWTNHTQGTVASGNDWQAVASDSTGTHLAAVCAQSVTTGGALYAGDIWTSSDSGTTWTNRTIGKAPSLQEWATVASDATGVHLIAAAAHGGANDIWTSKDSGITWVNDTARAHASGQQWVAVASDAIGAHLVAVTSGGPGGGPCCFGNIWTN